MTDQPIIDLDEIRWYVYATTNDEMHAAAIVRRLNEDEGREASYADVTQLRNGPHTIRSNYRHAVIAPRTSGMEP